MGSVRELKDGRVLVVDTRDRKLFVGDWRTRAATQIGREGNGPGEYALPRTLFPVSADSTLLPDPRNGRWLLLAGATIVETVPADAPAIRAGARTPLGADYAENVFATKPTALGPPATGAPHLDSLFLIRIARRTGKTDTLGTLRSRPARITVEGPSNNPTSVRVFMNPLAVGDEATVFPDGWIAIARVDPYRVDWIAPGGRLTAGAQLPDIRVRLDDREKRAVLDRNAANSGRGALSPDAVRDWPETLPPFLTGATLVAPDGRLWIQRTPSADHPESRYDIVGRRGTIEGRLTTDARTRVVGFGREAMFSVETDDDGIQHLRRHPLPRF